MANTLHIKRFEEYVPQLNGSEITIVAEEQAKMLNDLAEHIERLEQRYENHRHLDNGDGFTRTSTPLSDDQAPNQPLP